MMLPMFKPSERDRRWVSEQIQTASFIRALWAAAKPSQKRSPEFVKLLVCCGWTNVGRNDSGYDSTRKWRNQRIAEYLGVSYQSDEQLARELTIVFPRLKRPLHLLRTYTGISNYYKPLRPVTLKFVESHAALISKVFHVASSVKIEPAEKVKSVVNLISNLGSISLRGQSVSPLNGLTPTLACLDPYQKLPIMNEQTKRLLRFEEQSYDSAGAVALHKLIGRHGLTNAFELDVYSATTQFPSLSRPTLRKFKLGLFKDLGFKSEAASIAKIASKIVTITKQHNQLTGRLYEWLLWRKMTAKESRFDALVLEWRKGRHLLIEAKTESRGSIGRSQVRQGIGQLLDYRFTYKSRLPPGEIDLALLLPTKPENEIMELLKSLKIKVLWFERHKLEGTVRL